MKTINLSDLLRWLADDVKSLDTGDYDWAIDVSHPGPLPEMGDDDSARVSAGVGHVIDIHIHVKPEADATDG